MRSHNSSDQGARSRVANRRSSRQDGQCLTGLGPPCASRRALSSSASHQERCSARARATASSRSASDCAGALRASSSGAPFSAVSAAASRAGSVTARPHTSYCGPLPSRPSPAAGPEDCLRCLSVLVHCMQRRGSCYLCLSIRFSCRSSRPISWLKHGRVQVGVQDTRSQVPDDGPSAARASAGRMLLRPGLAASSADSREDASAGEAPVRMSERHHHDSSQSCVVQPGPEAPLFRKQACPSPCMSQLA